MSEGRDSDRSGDTIGERTSHTNRRNVLKAAAGTSAALLTGCMGGNPPSQDDMGTDDTKTGSGSEDGKFSGQTLTVSVWSGKYTEFFKNSIKPRYEEQTGATVKLVPGWSDIISKIKAAPEDDPPYDVSVTEGLFYKQARAENLFLELRKENVPNLEKVYPYVKNLRTTKYGVPVDGAPIAVMYNNNNIDYNIDKWQTLIDKNTRLTMDGGFYAYTLHIAAIVSQNMDGVKEMYNPDQHDAVFETAKKFNTAAFYTSGAERWQQMQQQIAMAAQSYFGVSMGRKSNNDWISVTLPQQTSGYYDHYGVVRGTDKRDMAEHFLDFMLATDVQTEWGKTSHQLLANKEASHSKAAKQAGFPSSNEEYKDFHFPDYEALAPHSDKLSNRFEKFKSNN